MSIPRPTTENKSIPLELAQYLIVVNFILWTPPRSQQLVLLAKKLFQENQMDSNPNPPPKGNGGISNWMLSLGDSEPELTPSLLFR
ncbi:hypothetical protein DSO57_1035910 [Entomophthora muscae]|uniref:Uncharacterized protein n=1 Tax=Entomophthora muscae TaxID=34485 RepID=A0ACC2RQA8_9FUNG|nr:hypothetical protein DSO57_1035910 [Entomophthora muscae]